MPETDHGQSAIILYGTETGTSQDLAEEIGRTLERLHFNTDVQGLDAARYNQFCEYSLTVFVVATTGQGDFPDNARQFWTSLLRKKLSSTTLSGVDYALVGLGDSSYPKFNWAARKLDKRLRQLGASQLLEPCEADEQGDEGTDGAFLAWLQVFREAVLRTFPLNPDQEPISNDVLLPSKWRLEQLPLKGQGHPVSSITNDVNTPTRTGGDHIVDSFPVTLEVNRRVTPAHHWQDVRFMSLRATKVADYLPGDAISISPRNMSVDVESLIERMRWQDVADVPLQLVSTRQHLKAAPSHLTTGHFLSRPDLTLRLLLTEFLDINAIPRRSFLGCIANYTNDEMHKERLLEFTDPQYLDEYYDYATRPRRSILEILQEFDSVQLPWNEVTNIFPAMRPRQFSIASGGPLKTAEDGSTKFELLVAIVKYRTVIKRIREGVCTRYLAHLPVGTTLYVSLKTEGRFSKTSALMSNSSHLLIGAGTGIAPLRSLIHEKFVYSHPGAKTGLFFGCRNKDADYFFHDEWVAIGSQHTSAVLEIVPAFSRDQAAKVYVQDQIRQRSDLVWEALRESEATIIVCGSSGQMPKAVRQALVDALVKEGARRVTDEDGPLQSPASDGGTINNDEDEEPIATQEDAERYLARLEKENRYQQETWS